MTRYPRFADRTDAGVRLAAVVRARLRAPVDLVLGLPRGGVIVARAVADELGLPLDVIVVRKVGAPGAEEFAIGAIAEGGIRVLDTALAARFAPDAVDRVERAERDELRRRVAEYRGERALDVAGRAVLVVDDGVATGSTALAACLAVRSLGAARVVVAAPVAAPDWREVLGDEADECIALAEPDPFLAVGRFYDAFPSTTDEEVRAALGA